MSTGRLVEIRECERLRVLVTGGAGFIGSTTAELLLNERHEVVVVDDLSRGERSNVPERADFVEGDCGDESLVTSLGVFDACVHFAGRIEPGESMKCPETFFVSNVSSTFHLVNALIANGTNRFVFSSSCAVYSDRGDVPIDEECPTDPQSAYGQSKLMVEEGLRWLVSQGRLRAATLRYFNAAGSTAEHPERHDPETHLIPIALDVALGRRPYLELYGDDLDTPDGTCVRDYIHVSDLAEAHVQSIAVLERLEKVTLNLGSGTGSSNREVVDMVKKVTGRDFEVRTAARRPGDMAVAIACMTRSAEILGWSPQRSDLENIVTDAWVARRNLK